MCYRIHFHFQKSSLGQDWPNPSVRLHGSSAPNEAAGMKYVVYRQVGLFKDSLINIYIYLINILFFIFQPLSLDRFFIHEVSPAEAATARLENAFILINLNRFQQIISVFTLQAESEQMRVNMVLILISFFHLLFIVLL